ncbi:hypothetical protein PG993_012976 [Apiospora rasikravindrae]|uniref:DUF5672 domain-containing protein n=1 Tax=Apiospora rasikravindrae TaxID=990691 RepID=A0ABR1RWC6_9PEZI
MASSAASLFYLNRTKILIVVSLTLTWYIAGLLPHYKPKIEAHFKSRLDEARQKIPSVKIDWHPNQNDDDLRRNYNTSKLALLIEPRPLPPPRSPDLAHDHRDPSGLAFATKHQQAIGKLDLMVLPEPWEIDSKEKVHRLLTDKRFYDEFLPGVEWILKYEYDSILCANSDQSLNNWLHWDWAGAPRTKGDKFAGNGGLSMRRVSAIQRVLKIQERQNDTQPEDEWFGYRVSVLPGALVAADTDGQLAVEDTYIPNSMGFHVRDGGKSLKPEVWQNPTQRKAIFDYCPELSLIMDMKLERERCQNDDKQGHLVGGQAIEKAPQNAKAQKGH